MQNATCLYINLLMKNRRMSNLRANAQNFVPTGVLNGPPETALLNNNNWRRNASLQRNVNTISRLFQTKRLESMNKIANKKSNRNNARQLMANVNAARRNQALNLKINNNIAENIAIAEAVNQNNATYQGGRRRKNRKITRKNRKANRKTRKDRR